MSRKSVAIKMPVTRSAASPQMEAWVQARTADVPEAPVASNVTVLPVPAEPMKRFTIDVAESLHKRIKAECAMRGTNMADVIREMLEGAFPVKS